MAREIRCGEDDGHGCGKLLAKSNGGTVTIVCPRCGELHSVPVLTLIAELSAWLAEVEAQAAAADGGKGFMM